MIQISQIVKGQRINWFKQEDPELLVHASRRTGKSWFKQECQDNWFMQDYRCLTVETGDCFIINTGLMGTNGGVFGTSRRARDDRV